MKRLPTFAWVWITLGLTACGGRSASRPEPPPRSAAPGPFAAATGLTATLVDPLTIELRWADNATHEGGYFVEGYFEAQAPTSRDFVVIEVLPPDATSYRHEKLMPEARFVYRVRPFFGRASNVAEITTGKTGGPQTQASSASPPPARPDIQTSLRAADTEALAAPADLRATLLPPTGVVLDWKDHAADEEQYLIEIRSGADAGFHVASFEPANSTRWVSYDFDPETTFAFRVRAFVRGEPSNVVEIQTGPDPSMGPGKWKRVE
jgi:hypothetical protein